MNIKWVEYYVAACITVILGACALLAYWSFWPYNIFTFYNEKNPILTPVVRHGDTVQWLTDVYQHTTGYEVRISRQLIDGFIINYPDAGYTTQEGRQTFVNASMRIPDYVPPGTYHVAIYNYIKVNPIRTITIIRETESFQVVE